MVIFTNGSRGSLRNLMSFLSQYEYEYGKLINKAKSCFVMGPKTSIVISNNIGLVIRFQKKELPLSYLGCVLFNGRKKVDYFSNILAKFKRKLASWKFKPLSQGRKIILVRHVLQCLLLYNMVDFDLPKSVLNRLEKICCNFF